MSPRLAATLLLLTACASAPPAPRPLAPPRAAAPPSAPLPPTEADRLQEAARLLADGTRLDRVAALLAAVEPGAPRRDVLLGQLAELGGDDAGAVTAYGRALALDDDDEVRLRRALALERLGRSAEAEADLRRLRAWERIPGPEEPGAEARPARKLRPLRPSSR